MSTISIASATGRLRGARVTRFLAALCAAALLCPAVDARAATVLPVGNVYTFSTGSTAGNPAGSWTLGDKMWSYVSSSNFNTTSPGGTENIQIIDAGTNNHSFNLGSLGSLATSSTSWLGYSLQVVPPSPYFLSSIALDSTHIVNNAFTYKDVFSSLSLFNSGAGAPGSGDLLNLQSFNGAPSADTPIPGGPTQVWVRDWIVLDATGAILSVNNNVTQAVPEIDLASFAGAFPLLVAGLALLERRRGARAGRTSPAAG